MGLIEVLSLGAGVQSTAILLMSVHGDLPKLDHAIFADTGWEPAEVYRHLEWLTIIAKDNGIQLHVVSHGSIKEDALSSQVRGKAAKGQRWASLPYYVKNGKTGKTGMIRRQCTKEYKIVPIEKCLRRTIMGLKPRQRAPREVVIRQWRGISSDEWQRIRKSDHVWMETWHPLVENRISRLGCHEWMRQHGYPQSPRSACIGCPFHSNSEWRHLRDNSPKEWLEAIEFDKQIRTCGGTRGEVFLHSQCVPLGEAKIDRDSPGQLLMWQDECHGMCGV